MTDKMNQKTTATFFDYLLTCYPKRRILLILDRASWHKGKPVESVLVRHPRLELFFLPTACPELNPQEHVWAVVRRSVMTATSFPRLVTAFLATWRGIQFRPSLFAHYAPPFMSCLTG